jgi:hypothetical protein
MFNRKNKDGFSFTKMYDLIITALIMEEEHYIVNHTDKNVTILWKNNIVKIQNECLWFNNKRQNSVYNVINAIKAGK